MVIEDNKNLTKPITSLIGYNFKDFLIQAFNTINPCTPFADNWHIDLVVHHLHEIEEQRIRRLLINIPPRSLKSTIISVAWPAWLLGHNPAKRVIVASYSMALSLKHSIDTRIIMSSDWYKGTFPNTEILKGNNQKFKFVTTQHGFRLATSVGGSLTGEGADILIADDPITPQQVMSKIRREKNTEWFSQTFATRLNDKKKGAMVVIMQRLHTEDLSDYLLKQKVWQHLSLPAVAEEDTTYQCGKFEYKREKGELLHPIREGLEEIEMARLELGSYGFNAQYQQAPLNMNNTIIKPQWILRYDELPTQVIYCQSWDCASKPGSHCDYNVCTTWLVADNKIYLADVFRRQLDFLDLKHMVSRLHYQFQPTAILIEDKASGHALIQELHQRTIIPVIPIIPTKDKFTRLLGISSFFEAGRIYFPKNAFWLAELESELFSFPNSRYDDQVDSITQFLD